MKNKKVKSIIYGLTVTLILIFSSFFLSRFLFSKLSINTPIDIFIFFSLASIVIFPSPLDLIYLDLLRKGIPHIFFTVLIGIFIGQNINYFLGRYFAKIIKPLIKEKTQKWITEKLYKYEGYAIFFINLSPLPYTALNFTVGLSQFKYYKWFLITLSSLLLKITILNFFYGFFIWLLNFFKKYFFFKTQNQKYFFF